MGTPTQVYELDAFDTQSKENGCKRVELLLSEG